MAVSQVKFVRQPVSNASGGCECFEKSMTAHNSLHVFQTHSELNNLTLLIFNSMLLPLMTVSLINLMTRVMYKLLPDICMIDLRSYIKIQGYIFTLDLPPTLQFFGKLHEGF